MSVDFTVKRFSKVGKGVPQAQLKDDEGNLLWEDNEKTKPTMGNEQYEAQQLTDESISHESAEAFLVDVLESVGSDLEKAARIFRKGWNDVTRAETGGTDEYTKAARGILKLGLSEFKGMSEEQVIEFLKSRK